LPLHFQGQAFLGPKKAATPREFIYAARDRMDETLDIIRAVRDKRYKYIRNYRPDLPYAQDIAYMNEMPTMKEWRRLAAAGELAGPQQIFFEPTKPIEELYDTQADPHEIHNLAADPQHAEVLARLRAVHEKWRGNTADLGLTPEAELNELRRPGGVWSITADPKIAVADGKAMIRCATDGASIAYRVAPSSSKVLGRWLLYTQPVPLAKGAAIEARACRLGFKESGTAAARGE
jgi:hypothetical protein